MEHDARLFTFVAGKKETKKISELDLTEETKVVFYYRDDQFHFIDEETGLKEGDEIIILAHCESLPDLK